MRIDIFFFFSSRRRHTRLQGDWSSDVCSSDLELVSAMRTLSDRDDNLRKPALERLIDEAKDAPVGAPEQLREVVATTVRGKRIASDSLVLTDRGIVQIGSLGVGLGADEADSIGVTVHGTDGPEPASLVYSGGISDTLVVTTRLGYCIQVTPEHPLLVRTMAGELEWRRADKLMCGDVLALQRGQRMFGSRTQVDFIYERRAKQDHSRRIAIGHLDEELAYFMGIIT